MYKSKSEMVIPVDLESHVLFDLNIDLPLSNQTLQKAPSSAVFDGAFPSGRMTRGYKQYKELYRDLPGSFL